MPPINLSFMKSIFSLTFLLSYSTVFSQVGIGTVTPNSSARLEVSATDKGFLPPRVALTGTADASTISTPATGLLVYNTATAGSSPANVTPGFYYYDGSKWQRISNNMPTETVTFSVNANPNTGGTTFSGTVANTNYIYVSTIDNSQWTYNGSAYVAYAPPANTSWYASSGTTDAGVNKTGSIYRTGAIGIGASSPAATLEVGSSNGTTSGLVVINPQNTSNEGGEIMIQKSVSSSTNEWHIDQYRDASSPVPRFRIFPGADESKGLSIHEDGKINIGGDITSKRAQTDNLYVSGTVKITGNLNAAGGYYAVAGLSSSQTLNNTEAVIAMTDKDDPNNWWDGSNYRFTPTVAGYYLVAGSVNFAAVSGTYNCNIQIRKNGSTVVAITQDLLPSSISITQNATAIVYLNGSGDYVHMTGYTNANTTITGDASQLWTKLEAYKIN